MGDTLEFSTLFGHQRVFYKITSSAINFEVKAAGFAGIGLATKCEPECAYLVALGVERHTWIKKIGGTQHREAVETPNILSDQEYRRFWISWNANGIKVGRDCHTKPILSCKSVANNLKYVTFFVPSRYPFPVHWRVQLPPVIQRPISKPISGGELYWVPKGDIIPNDAIIGGHEKENLYIIRAKHRGSLTPGKFAPVGDSAFISWGGEAHPKTEYEILCGFNCMWVPSFRDRIPVGAVVGGQSENSAQEKLFIGRAKYLNHIIPGKVQPSFRVCFIAFEGREIGVDKFEILVVPDTNRSANTILLPSRSMEVDYLQDDTDEDEVDEEDNEDVPNAAF